MGLFNIKPRKNITAKSFVLGIPGDESKKARGQITQIQTGKRPKPQRRKRKVKRKKTRRK